MTPSRHCVHPRRRSMPKPARSSTSITSARSAATMRSSGGTRGGAAPAHTALHCAEEMAAGRRLDLPDRATIFVREATGPVGARTVLLVHGLLGTADLNWSLAIPELSSRFRVIAPDLRGHGDGIATRRFDGGQCADDLAAIVELLELGRVIVAGYSLGVLVAQLFAL